MLGGLLLLFATAIPYGILILISRLIATALTPNYFALSVFLLKGSKGGLNI